MQLILCCHVVTAPDHTAYGTVAKFCATVPAMTMYHGWNKLAHVVAGERTARFALSTRDLALIFLVDR